jgi:hypothetical protein
MGNCLQQPGLIRNHPKVYESNFKPTYQTFGTLTTPATVTKSIGLPADAQLAAFFAPIYKIYLDN